MTVSNARKQLIEMLQELLFGLSNPAKLWGSFLTAPESTFSSIVKDSSFTILTTCLLETAESKEKRFPRMRELAESLSKANVYYSLAAFEQLCDDALRILDDITERELVILQLVRHRIVHGYLGGRLQNDRKLKVVREGQIQAISLDRVKLESLICLDDAGIAREVRVIRLRLEERIVEHSRQVSSLQSSISDLGGLDRLFEEGHYFFK